MRSQSYKEIRKRLVDIAKIKKSPVLGHFELTARCNLDCKMCYVHNQDNSEALKKELTTDQWKRIFDEAIQNGLLYASLSGGECLIRKDFKELYLHLWNQKVYVTVMTNGVMLNEEYIKFFTTYRPDMIQISLYGRDDEGYLNVTGHTGFNKVLSAIRALEEAGIDVRVGVTPSKYMKDEYLSILQLCKDNKFHMVLNDIVLLPNRDDPDKADYYLTLDEILDLSIGRARLKGEVLPVDSVPETCGDLNCSQPCGLKCNGGNCLATVTYDGKMHPCVNAMIGGASLLDMGYADAWKKTVESTARFKTAIECVGCPYDNVCPKCAAIRLKDMDSGHCNPEICQLYKDLVKAGVKKL